MSNKPASPLTTRANNSRQITGQSVVIPKEQLTAFERWELSSFNSPGEEKKQDNALAVLSELEIIRQRAYDEGYKQGRDEGYAAGMQQTRNDVVQINAILQNLQGAINQVDDQIAQSLLDLSLEIGRKMTGEALKVNPELILKIINDAISGLPHFNQNAHLILNPDDAELVRKHLGEHLSNAGWKIFTDVQIRRGGCRLETAHSHVDATVEARWKRVVESIGQDKSWLA